MSVEQKASREAEIKIGLFLKYMCNKDMLFFGTGNYSLPASAWSEHFDKFCYGRNICFQNMTVSIKHTILIDSKSSKYVFF